MQDIPFHCELVVARYEEDLRWLRRVPQTIRIKIYNKGATPALPDDFPRRRGLTVTPLPNVGREAHSYLFHLSNQFQELAPITVFAQGHPFDHAPDFHVRLKSLADGLEAPSPFLWYGFLDETDDPYGQRLFVPWSKNPEGKKLSTGSLYQELFDEASPDFFCFRGGAQFSVSREAVIQRPRDFYLRSLKLSTSIDDAAHSLERFWDRFFGEPIIDPMDLGENGVRYLKKINRLKKERDSV